MAQTTTQTVFSIKTHSLVYLVIVRPLILFLYGVLQFRLLEQANQPALISTLILTALILLYGVLVSRQNIIIDDSAGTMTYKNLWSKVTVDMHNLKSFEVNDFKIRKICHITTPHPPVKFMSLHPKDIQCILRIWKNEDQLIAFIKKWVTNKPIFINDAGKRVLGIS